MSLQYMNKYAKFQILCLYTDQNGINYLFLGNLTTIVPEIPVVMNRLKRELLDPVLVTGNTKKTSETQTETTPHHPQQPIIPEGIPGLLPNATPDVLPRYITYNNLQNCPMRTGLTILSHRSFR